MPAERLPMAHRLLAFARRQTVDPKASNANLTLERDAMGTMLGHGFYLQKPDKGGQIYELKVSTRRGALQGWVSFPAVAAGSIEVGRSRALGPDQLGVEIVVKQVQP